MGKNYIYLQTFNDVMINERCINWPNLLFELEHICKSRGSFTKSNNMINVVVGDLMYLFLIW